MNGGSLVVGEDVYLSLEGLGDSFVSGGTGPTATGGGSEGGLAGVQSGMGPWVFGSMSSSKRSMRSWATFLYGGRGKGCGEVAFRSSRSREFLLSVGSSSCVVNGLERGNDSWKWVWSLLLLNSGNWQGNSWKWR